MPQFPNYRQNDVIAIRRMAHQKNHPRRPTDHTWFPTASGLSPPPPIPPVHFRNDLVSLHAEWVHTQKVLPPPPTVLQKRDAKECSGNRCIYALLRHTGGRRPPQKVSSASMLSLSMPGLN